MNYKIQLISLMVSFIFGIFFYFASLLNYKIIKNYNRFFRYITTFIYMLNVAIIYICLLFKLNNGNVHLYFLIMVFCGFLFGMKLKKTLTKNVKLYEFIDKRKQK